MSTGTEYDVSLDGTRVWPRADSTFPPSVIRTVGRSPVRILFGSCRTAAPHEPPWTLEMSIDTKGRGVDAMRSHALRMMGQPVDQWFRSGHRAWVELERPIMDLHLAVEGGQGVLQASLADPAPRADHVRVDVESHDR